MGDQRSAKMDLICRYVGLAWASARANPLTASLVFVWLGIAGYLWYWMFTADINLMLNVIPWSAVLFVVFLIFAQIFQWVVGIARYAVRVILWLLDLVRLLSEDRKAQDPNTDLSEFEEFERGLRARLPVAQMMSMQSMGIVRSMNASNAATAKWVIRLPILLFSVALTTAFFFAAYISGDWTDGERIPACFMGFHFHHWQSAAIALTGLLYIATRNVSAYPKLARYAYGVSGFLLLVLVAILSLHGNFPSTPSMWALLSSYIAFTFFLGRVLRSQETRSLWFALFMVASIGAAAGTFLDGVRSTIDDFPASIIYYDGCAK